MGLEGITAYYQSKIEELEIVTREKGANLRRLQAQRNELNSQGKIRISKAYRSEYKSITSHFHCRPKFPFVLAVFLYNLACF
jgi:hypothetical protein